MPNTEQEMLNRPMKDFDGSDPVILEPDWPIREKDDES